MKNDPSPGGNIGKKSIKTQPLTYHEGLPKAGNNLGDVRDAQLKTPYGGKTMGWAAKAGKLDDLDPKESDQPTWVNTWSPLQEGPNAAGPVRDENYVVQRPRTYTRQKDRFQLCNPEFQDVADVGDWTSYDWTNNV